MGRIATPDREDWVLLLEGLPAWPIGAWPRVIGDGTRAPHLREGCEGCKGYPLAPHGRACIAAVGRCDPRRQRREQRLQHGQCWRETLSRLDSGPRRERNPNNSGTTTRPVSEIACRSRPDVRSQGRRHRGDARPQSRRRSPWQRGRANPAHAATSAPSRQASSRASAPGSKRHTSQLSRAGLPTVAARKVIGQNSAISESGGRASECRLPPPRTFERRAWCWSNASVAGQSSAAPHCQRRAQSPRSDQIPADGRPRRPRDRGSKGKSVPPLVARGSREAAKRSRTRPGRLGKLPGAVRTAIVQSSTAAASWQWRPEPDRSWGWAEDVRSAHT